MNWFLFEGILISILIVSFFLFAFYTNKVIEEQDELYAELQQENRRLKEAQSKITVKHIEIIANSDIPIPEYPNSEVRS